MIFLGVVLLVLGYVMAIPLLLTLGWLFVFIGVILLLFGATVGRPVLGRRWWY